jgi:hypothetical protein
MHEGGGGRREGRPEGKHKTNFNRLVNKNATKHKKWDPMAIFPESLEPPTPKDLPKT